MTGSTWRFNYPEHPGLEHWLNYGERGVSSNAIVQYLVHGTIPALSLIHISEPTRPY